MTGATSIRDVIAFPKTKTAECPLTQAPAPVEANQLRDLGIRLREQQRKKLNCSLIKTLQLQGVLLDGLKQTFGFISYALRKSTSVA